MNIAQVNREAVRDHGCPDCQVPRGKRCRSAVRGKPGRWQELLRPHNARTALVTGDYDGLGGPVGIAGNE